MTRLIKSCTVPLAAFAALTFALPLTAANGGLVRIIQTNSAGDSVHIIDAATNKVIAEIPGIERAHGAAASPDGTFMWISNEADNTVDVIDSKTMKVTKKIPLSGHPNNLAITPDGKKLYVAIAQAPGAVDVIDAAKQARAKTISVHGGVHIRLPVLREKPVVPYLVFGAGGLTSVNHTVTASYKDDTGAVTQVPLTVPGGTNFAVNTGGGIRFYIGQRFGLRVEAKAYKPTGDFTDVFGKVEGG